MLETGLKVNWSDIKVGEVFAWNGCWIVGLKLSEGRVQVLARDDTDLAYYNDTGFIEIEEGCILDVCSTLRHNVYKLPTTTQEFWLTK